MSQHYLQSPDLQRRSPSRANSRHVLLSMSVILCCVEDTDPRLGSLASGNLLCWVLRSNLSGRKSPTECLTSSAGAGHRELLE